MPLVQRAVAATPASSAERANRAHKVNLALMLLTGYEPKKATGPAKMLDSDRQRARASTGTSSIVFAGASFLIRREQQIASAVDGALDDRQREATERWNASCPPRVRVIERVAPEPSRGHDIVAEAARPTGRSPGISPARNI